MATRYRFGDSSLPHFITFAVVNWIDVFVWRHWTYASEPARLQKSYPKELKN